MSQSGASGRPGERFDPAGAHVGIGSPTDDVDVGTFGIEPDGDPAGQFHMVRRVTRVVWRRAGGRGQRAIGRIARDGAEVGQVEVEGWYLKRAPIRGDRGATRKDGERDVEPIGAGAIEPGAGSSGPRTPCRRVVFPAHARAGELEGRKLPGGLVSREGLYATLLELVGEAT